MAAHSMKSAKESTQEAANSEFKTSKISEAEVEDIRVRCKVPGLSVAVLHQGKVLYHQHAGFRRLGQSLPHNAPDFETLYTISSLSKTFVASSFSILADDGMIKWTDPVSKYLPDFAPKDDPEIANASFEDILRHSSGIDNPVVTWLGPHGRAFIARDKFINLLNEAPTRHQGSSRRNTLVYSNVAYGLVVLVIEKVSRTSFADFVQTRILDPLKMHSTAVTISQLKAHEEHGNIAHPYAQMSNGVWKPLEHNWTNENNGPVLGMIGIRSSVKDLLVFVSALMDAYDASATELSRSRLGADSWSRSPFELLAGILVNPLKGAQEMLDGPYYERYCECNNGQKHIFEHLVPWIKVTMPCSRLSEYSFNVWSWKLLGVNDEEVLGASMKPGKLAFSFHGVGFCGTTSVKFFPETRSAVVSCSSGLNTGDAAEFASLLATERLFGLEPKLDIIRMIDTEALCSERAFEEKFMKELHAQKQDLSFAPHLSEFEGHYKGLGITLVVRQQENGNFLELSLNNQQEVTFGLEPYRQDCFSYWPKSRDDWLAGGWLDWDHYEVGLISFRRDDGDSREVIDATWVLNDRGTTSVFTRIKDDNKVKGMEPHEVMKGTPGAEDVKAEKDGDCLGNPIKYEGVEASKPHGWRCIVM